MDDRLEIASRLIVAWVVRKDFDEVSTDDMTVEALRLSDKLIKAEKETRRKP